MSLIDRLCLPDEWRCFVVAASCPVCLRPRRLRLRRRCTLSSHSSTPSKRSNPCDVLTLARRHTAAMCVRCSSPLSSFLRCFMTEISSAASRVRLSRRRRSKLRGGRGGRGGREGGERQEQTGRPALARPRAVRQTLPPPRPLFSPSSPQPLWRKYARARYGHLSARNLGFSAVLFSRRLVVVIFLLFLLLLVVVLVTSLLSAPLINHS